MRNFGLKGSRQSSRTGGLLFLVMFVFLLLCIFITMVSGAFLAVQCYVNGDPNHISCFMISDRHEIGIRER
jgi:hypothetical protein